LYSINQVVVGSQALPAAFIHQAPFGLGPRSTNKDLHVGGIKKRPEILVPKRVFLASGHSLPMLAAAVHFPAPRCLLLAAFIRGFLQLGTGSDVLDLQTLNPKPRKRVREKRGWKSQGFKLSSSFLLVLVLEDEGLDVTNCGVQSWHGVSANRGPSWLLWEFFVHSFLQ
jgi:hypothetical protein